METLKTPEPAPRKNPSFKLKTLSMLSNPLVFTLELALFVSVLSCVIYLTGIIPWLQLFLKTEYQKALTFFIYCYKIILFLFRGDKENYLVEMLSDPQNKLLKNTFYVILLQSASKVHEKIVNINWLYWSMLFVPFYVAYVAIQEKFLKMKQSIEYLKADVRLKNTFINWQGEMHTALHQRIAELRVETKTLSSLLDGYRKHAMENDFKSKLLRKNHSEERGQDPEKEGETSLSSMSPEQVSSAKKNKSDSAIEGRRDTKELFCNARSKPRPKTEGNNSPITVFPRKCSTAAWVESRKRLQEKSKDTLKARVESVHRSKAEEPSRQLSQTLPSVEERKPLPSPKTVQEILPVDKRIAIARSKFTSRRSSDDSRTLIPRDSKISSKRRSDDGKCGKCQTLRETETMKSKSPESDTSVSATDLLQQRDPFCRLTSKKRSLSEPDGKDVMNPGLNSKQTLNSQDIITGSNFGNEDIVANLNLEGLGRVTSYTEIYKKKVHLPNSGKAPEITIEGRRRWCF